MDAEMLKARVVLIYKKGDTNNFDNYRPISLLNSLYKMFAAILQRRIASVLDNDLQDTQTNEQEAYAKRRRFDQRP